MEEERQRNSSMGFRDIFVKSIQQMDESVAQTFSRRESYVKKDSFKNFINFFIPTRNPSTHWEFRSMNLGEHLVSPLVNKDKGRPSISLIPDLEFILGDDRPLETTPVSLNNFQIHSNRACVFNMSPINDKPLAISNELCYNNDAISEFIIDALPKQDGLYSRRGLPDFSLFEDAKRIVQQSGFLNESERKRFLTLISARFRYPEGFSRALSITKYKYKKNRRKTSCKVKYRVRQDMANTRPRVQGKFVKTMKVSLLGIAARIVEQEEREDLLRRRL